MTSPEMVFVPDVLRSAPPVDTPLPRMVSGSASVMPLEIERVAPLTTLVAPSVVPSADAWDTASVPSDTVVVPLYVPEVANVSVVDDPDFAIPPVPVIVPLKVVLPAEPLVKVPAPSEIVPTPVIDPTSSELPARLKVAPAATDTAVLFDNTFDAPSVMVPELMVVAPV